ncbi:xanthine dehydrogenase family protein molybdopterin-binding subunit [Chryseobacterium sp. JAH]|uniref:xanthine dehydrogenase family protein molybdopterin-binding subunit n=1 Tax=Chryseobacterium sp. JAH TaxID=1742858 RepID=UPI000740D1C6|nr:molybdopterin cofactor-binding domain-containing protein [Chryseobacterium sp. JAH]KUJ50039.1 xanthine dehydrogenase [Chryseobacterium sp. JAH]
MSKNTEINNLSRRKFLSVAGLGAGALCLGYFFPASASVVKILDTKESLPVNDIPMNAWIHINKDGQITLFDHRAEMGQGSFQSVPQIIAEELEVDLKDINVEFAPGDRTKYGGQITGGSSTIRGGYKRLLNLGAAARMMLIQAAANQWNVDTSACYAQSGCVIHKSSGKKLTYGQLVESASKLEAPKNIQLKPVSEYKLIRKPLKRRDTPLKTNGSAIFGLDKRIPGMLFASVERNPKIMGTVKSFDDTETLKIKGVKEVFKIRAKVHNVWREGVAVVADSTWSALQGRKHLKVEWDESQFKHINSTEVLKEQRNLLASQEGLTHKTQGNVKSILSDNNDKLDVIYETPYQVHYAMEPLNCIAHWKGDSVEIWGPVQAPELIQDAIAQEFKIPWQNIKVNMTFLGGGFGRKASADYPYEAAIISKQIGKPVQVVWTREDETTGGLFRPGITYRCEGVVKNGKIEALRVRLCGQNISHFAGSSEDKTKANGSASEGFLQPYYEAIKNIAINDVPFEAPVPVHWWRSVYASTNGFAYESFIDELAVKAKIDSMDFRRMHLQEDRLQKLIDKLEEVSGWKSRGREKGYGVAITECFSSTVGQVIKVSRNGGGKIVIDKIWAVMDCGWFVNPDIIHGQIEGSIIMGLGAATMHELTFTDGEVNQKNFYAYNLPRIMDMPKIEVHIIENDEDAGGVGEPALPPFAPALANAVYDLTGTRIRKLPFGLDSL